MTEEQTLEEMTQLIIDYVLVEPDEPPEPGALLNFIKNMGFQLRRYH